MKKYVISLISAAIVMLGLMGAVQYFMAKENTERELLIKAARDLEESKRVDAVQAEVEAAVRNVLNAVKQNLGEPDRYYALSTQMVRNNPHIVGAGVAFKPNYYLQKGKDELYAPYAYDEQPDVRVKKRKTGTPQIRTELLGFDYTTREWFQKPMEDGKGLWTQPYVDQGGTHIIMSTYVEPLRDSQKRIVGVFFADVPMEDVSLLSMEMNSGISRNGKISLLIQFISLLVFGFIVWLAVKASQQYREQNVDVEKEQLIAEIAKLKETNQKLLQRNMELGKMMNKKLLQG
jgi:hypothetical protein